MHVRTAKELRAMDLEQLTESEYNQLRDGGMLYEYFPEATGHYGEDMKRIDKIGQNGNDGLVYESMNRHGHRPRDGASPTYISWTAMKARCNNPSHPNYGGAGISYNKEWEYFPNFLADMGERPKGHTIERLEREENYSKENCVWADSSTQARNRSTTIYLTHDDETMCLVDWSELTGIPKTTLYRRYHQGLRGDDLFKPTCHMENDND